MNDTNWIRFFKNLRPQWQLGWRELGVDRVNPEFERIFLPNSQGRPLLEACPELVGQGFDELLREVMRTGKATVCKEVLAKVARTPGGPT